MGYYSDPYPEVRELLATEYREASPEKIEEVLKEALGSNSPEAVEDFLSTLSTVLPVIGAAVGTIISPGIGTAVGGAAGTVAGKAVSGVKPRQPPPTRAAATRPSVPAPPAGSRSTAKGSPAAGQLLVLLFRPEVLEALIAMTLGQAGRQHVRLGNDSVPVAAFANLLGVLANQAAVEYNAKVRPDGEGIPEYLLDSEGEFKCDIAVPEERANLLAEMLQAHPARQPSSESDDRVDDLHSWAFANGHADDDDIYESVYDDDDT